LLRFSRTRAVRIETAPADIATAAAQRLRAVDANPASDEKEAA
jgi:hypothetical protein